MSWGLKTEGINIKNYGIIMALFYKLSNLSHYIENKFQYSAGMFGFDREYRFLTAGRSMTLQASLKLVSLLFFCRNTQ